MATSVRGGGNGGKEKRGTSPSSVLKKSSKPSSSNQNSSSSSLNDEKTSSPTETSKPVPNYLKPTMSSSLDFSRLPRKSGSDTSAQKPALRRRRSFDRPPPSAQVQRAVRGPSVGPPDTKPQRSTSFSNKNAPSVRPASEKLFARTSSLKDKKGEEPKMSRSKSVKKSTLSSTSTRKEQASSSASSAKKAPRSVTSESSVDHENPSVDHGAIEEDDLVNLDDHEVQSLPEMSEMPDGNQELADPTNFEVDGVKHLQEDPEGGTVKEDHHFDHEDKSTLVHYQVALEKSTEDQEIGNADNHQTVQQVSADGDQQKVEAAGRQNLVGGEKDGAVKTASEVEPTEATVEEKKEDNKEEEEEEMKVTEPEKVDQQESEGKDEKQTDSSPSAEAAAPEKTQSSPGQKDKQAYNDVIEETATKLRGKKNKVLALAGAFETVISLDKS